MYNSDGTLRVKLNRKPAPLSSVNLGWGESCSKENNAAASNSPKAAASPKAAGVKSKITSIRGSDSPLRANNRPGSDVRAKANQGSLSFLDSSTAAASNDRAELGLRGVSDAKKKALFGSSVFENDEEAVPTRPSNELSEHKLREVTGHDIFHREDAPEEVMRATLGGVRKAPGGGSSLVLEDRHPETPGKPALPPKGADRHPGGKSSFGFGW